MRRTQMQMRSKTRGEVGPQGARVRSERVRGPLCATLAAGLLALGGAGCTAVAAGGLGLMLGHEFQSGAQIVHYELDARTVWRGAKETLAHLSERQPIFKEDDLKAYATAGGGSVSLQVVEVSPVRARLAVKARKYGLQNEELALSVLESIDRHLRRR
ncbi:MAG: hypothetical protein AAFU73_19430 [Planctomycetota bacterium]